MKKYFLILITLLSTATLWAQSDDDVYFVPKKTPKTKTTTETFYIGSDRDVDEYNRHGAFASEVEELDVDDMFDFEMGDGVYPDSLYEEEYVDDESFEEPYDEDDYYYSRELGRWYGCWNPYLWGWYSPWYGPWYAGYWGWYDPWYWGYWGGWYSPWYYYPIYIGGWGGHGGHHGDLAHNRGWGFTNRHGNTIASDGSGKNALGKRNGGNVYNDIARRSATASTNSSRLTGASRTFGNSGASRSTSTTRSYTPSTSSRSSVSSFSSGSRGGSFGGGTRSGGFGGGSHGGGRR